MKTRQEQINDIVCEYFGIESFIEPGRKRKFVRQRMIAQYLGRLYSSDTNEKIGDKTGRSHCAVSHAMKSITWLLKEPCFDSELKTDIENLKYKIKKFIQ